MPPKPLQIEIAESTSSANGQLLLSTQQSLGPEHHQADEDQAYQDHSGPTGCSGAEG